MSLPPFRAWFLVVGTTLTILCLFYLFFDRFGLFLGFLVSLAWNYVMLIYKHKTSIDYFEGKKIEGQDPWHINECLRSLESELRAPKIEVYECNSSAPILIASTLDWYKPYLIISTSLINTLSEPELQALLCLGVSSIKHRNLFFRYTFERIAFSWISIGTTIDRILMPIGRGWNLTKRLFYWVGWLHLKLAFSKKLQAQADLEAYQFLTEPRHLANALWKIHGTLDTQKDDAIPEIFRHQSLFAHPHSRRSAFQFILPIELRLKFLVGYFPI